MPSSQVMHEFSQGTLNSGKGGPIVKSRKQALAIMLSEMRKEGKKVKPRKGNMLHGH